MKKYLFLSVFFIILIFACSSCKEISMEPIYNILKLKNKSFQKIKVLLNVQYPDTMLNKSFPDKYINPQSEDYIGNAFKLDKKKGITVFIFDYEYYHSQWNEKVGTPNTFLEEDKILKKYILTKSELDSLNWILIYP